MRHVVLDANVILAAFCFPGVCRSVMDVCIADHQVVVSEYLLAEVRRHLCGKFNHDGITAEARINLLRQVASVAVPVDVKPDACRDPADLPILGTAVAGGADCLITGDQDLLVLESFGPVVIQSPRQFWDSLK